MKRSSRGVSQHTRFWVWELRDHGNPPMIYLLSCLAKLVCLCRRCLGWCIPRLIDAWHSALEQWSTRWNPFFRSAFEIGFLVLRHFGLYRRVSIVMKGSMGIFKVCRALNKHWDFWERIFGKNCLGWTLWMIFYGSLCKARTGLITIMWYSVWLVNNSKKISRS